MWYERVDQSFFIKRVLNTLFYAGIVLPCVSFFFQQQINQSIFLFWGVSEEENENTCIGDDKA